ncbi:MAG TPA: hypothetical protein VE076_00790 [Nitrososphaeraceae archaeon]|nr:hypothetical protein [Nitrososphaeraceae archaeon]
MSIRDPIIVRIVSILDIASLSILELLEYNLTRKDINYALLNGVIAVDKSAASSSTAYKDTQPIQDLNILVSGDFYFHNFLSSKVKLTDVGLYILDTIKGGEKLSNNNVLPNEIEGQKPQQQGFPSP